MAGAFGDLRGGVDCTLDSRDRALAALAALEIETTPGIGTALGNRGQ